MASNFCYLSVLTLVLSGCGEPFLSTLKPAGEVAETQYDLMILSTCNHGGSNYCCCRDFLVCYF